MLIRNATTSKALDFFREKATQRLSGEGDVQIWFKWFHLVAVTLVHTPNSN